MLDALKPSMKALVQHTLLKHSDIHVKVAIVSCVRQITPPDEPSHYVYNSVLCIFVLLSDCEFVVYVQDIFHFSFEDIADHSSRSYINTTSILETVSSVRLCVIMLHLECHALIVAMFEHFLTSVRDYHHESIYPSMESIILTTFYVHSIFVSAKDCTNSSCSATADRAMQGFIDTVGERDGVLIGEPTEVEGSYVVPGGMRKIVNELLNDVKRIEYHSAYLASLVQSMREGADIRGYFAWSLMDSYEWLQGYSVRYGFYYVFLKYD